MPGIHHLASNISYFIASAYTRINFCFNYSLRWNADEERDSAFWGLGPHSTALI